MTPAVKDRSPPARAMISINKKMQSQLIIELAWRTVGLMQRNKLIQQKILDLQKETSDFVKAITQNPINKQQYIEYMTSYGYDCSQLAEEINNIKEEGDDKENVPKEEPMT